MSLVRNQLNLALCALALSGLGVLAFGVGGCAEELNPQPLPPERSSVGDDHGGKGEEAPSAGGAPNPPPFSDAADAAPGCDGGHDAGASTDASSDADASDACETRPQ